MISEELKNEIDPYGEEIWEEQGPPEENYKSYYDTNGRPILPMAMRVASRTIGLDLVAVVPMGSHR